MRATANIAKSSCPTVRHVVRMWLGYSQGIHWCVMPPFLPFIACSLSSSNPHLPLPFLPTHPLPQPPSLFLTCSLLHAPHISTMWSCFCNKLRHTSWIGREEVESDHRTKNHTRGQRREGGGKQQGRESSLILLAIHISGKNKVYSFLHTSSKI